MANKKIIELQEKRDALNARIQREVMRERSSERRNDTRRKVLVGATILQAVKKDAELAARLQRELQAFLVKPRDRALFGLPILDETSEAKTG